jgi:hypothetical protein
VRRKGKYVNDTLPRRKNAEEWAIEIERRIDRGKPPLAANSSEQRRFEDLIRRHREDLREWGSGSAAQTLQALLFSSKDLGDRIAAPELLSSSAGQSLFPRIEP